MGNIINAKDLREGNTFWFRNNLYQVIENSFNKTAMREGIVKCKVKNLKTGTITVEVLTGEKLEQAIIENKKMNFSYIDNTNYVFIDNETWEQIEIPEGKLQWEKKFLVEGTEIIVAIVETELLGINLPDQMTFVLTEAEEAVQGNTVQNVTKKAWIATGFEISVPHFVKKNEKVIIDTRTGKYIGRTK